MTAFIFSMSKANKSWKHWFSVMVNQNRLNAVLSKIGQLNVGTKDDIQLELEQDVWSDYYINSMVEKKIVEGYLFYIAIFVMLIVHHNYGRFSTTGSP